MTKRFKHLKYYRKLSKKERRQFRVNCERYDKGRFKYILSSAIITDYKTLIEFAFSWPHTPEQGKYWLEISRKFD
jgi:hypothetical protein